MTAVGGFFELEASTGAGVWHREALALTSGRACLRAILESARPDRMLVPFYVCDAALEPLRMLGIPYDFYRLTPSLDPDVSAWPGDAAILFVNYFDLKGRHASRIAGILADRVVIDDTQAFFRRGYGRCRSFNSARKFFGVPDGAYLYGPDVTGIRPRGSNDRAPAEHLTTRKHGNQELAYQQYVAAEAQVSCDVLSPSPLSLDLLGGIDYEGARAARRRNFARLHDGLSGRNSLSIDFTLDAEAAPFCYPFLPSRPSLHRSLWEQEIFVPRLWPEIASRPANGFEWERDLAARLLPLPVDHRYGDDDMDRVARAVLQVAA